MKKLRANMDRYFDKLDERWQALPVRKQHQYTLYFFVGYLLLTAGVIFKVWKRYDHRAYRKSCPQKKWKSCKIAG